MKTKKIFSLAIIPAVVFILLSVLQTAGIFSWVENKAYDLRMKQSADSFCASDDISVVLIDQSSLDWTKENLGWSWPWPREAYAQMVKFFNRGNAASVAFDMIYSDPSLYGTEDDEKFIQACADYGKVIQTVFYESNDSSYCTLPLEGLKDTAAMLGNVQSLLDSDGTARQARFYSTSELKEPNLGIASLMISDKMPELDSIPKSKSGGMYVRYLPGLEAYIPYNAEQVLRSEMAIEDAEAKGIPYDSGEDLLDPEQFENSNVFFGVYASGLYDICSTPISSNYPGVGVHINQVNTILEETYLSDVSNPVIILILLVCVITGALFAKSSSKEKWYIFLVKTILFVLILGIFVILNYQLFIKGFIVPVTAPLLALILTFVSTLSKNYMTEGKQKRFIKSAFSQYLSPAVIDSLIANPDSLQLGGEEREITAYFSDVQGFTSISENLSPVQLTELLNRYLTVMTEIILASGGTIDKYEGDAIIALWNAPYTQKDHAKRALEAALACQKKLEEMQDELTAVTGKPFKQRIGLNTGRAVVGNMGSTQRFDYTMLGDTVNLASRLEGINKQFGTYTMCSQATMESAVANGCKLEFRKVSDIAVVGRKNGVTVFEPMQPEEFKNRSSDFENFSRAYALFEKGDFQNAKELFEKTKDSDPAALKYIEKCNAFIKNPPENWDGVLKATEK